MDIDAIKSKLATLQSTSNTKDNFWKPEPGKQVVRIVPYKHNKDNPFIELFFHYNLGNNKTYLSPMSFGRPDPVQEFADKLKSTGTQNINVDKFIQTAPFSAKEKGSFIIFPSFVHHQVTPVTTGRRISLVSWYHGNPYV